MKSKLPIKAYMQEMVKKNASDLYITCGFYPCIRVNNKVEHLGTSLLGEQEIREMITGLLEPEHLASYYTDLELDYSTTMADGSRFRFNFFHQQNLPGFVARRITSTIPTIDELGLPEIYKELSVAKHGLIVFASPTGSGKSTSMAALVNHRNYHSTGHILTIEDPIEYIHDHGNCIVTQREVGTDTHSYQDALYNALRQRADVIAIGEIRDRNGLDHALRFAETGHLCMTTLHANNSVQAIERMRNMFDDIDRPYVQASLSYHLLSVLSQRLVPAINGKRQLSVEVLLNVGIIKNLIADGKIDEISQSIEKIKEPGMQSMNQSLLNLYQQELITKQVAIAESDDPSDLRLKMDQMNELDLENSSNLETKNPKTF